MLNQPAGHLENGESLRDAVSREVLEETRWQFEPDYISGIYRWVHDNGDTYLRICYVGKVSHEHPERMLDSGIEQAIWLSEDEIRQHPALRSPLVLKCMDDYLAGSQYPLSLIQDMIA